MFSAKFRDINLADSLIILGLVGLYSLKMFFDFKTPVSAEKSEESIKKDLELKNLYVERELTKTRLEIKRLTKAEEHEEKFDNIIPRF